MAARLRTSIEQNELTIERLDTDIGAIEASIARRRVTRAEHFRMVIDGRAYDDRGEAGQALRDRLAVPGEIIDQPAAPSSTIEGVAELGELTFDATIWHSRMCDGYDSGSPGSGAPSKVSAARAPSCSNPRRPRCPSAWRTASKRSRGT
ncbi:hypothetical protein ACQPZQ_28315 [Pseudonocardia sp. CA-142604]|uniref:hypothetical protein n=1 Tax=Pseudonocardia sp. CA-142604 TaxID=3240024 RepID=UPI003D8DD3C8